MIYVFLANGFEEIEALTPVDYLRRCSLEVVTVGIGSKQVRGAHGITILADIMDSEVQYDKITAVILPGGMPGANNLNESSVVQKAIDYCVENNLYIGAICAAPFILGRKGLLKGKNAICFPGFEKELLGAKIADAPVCVDDKIITAKGPAVANQFAFQLAALFASEEEAEKLKATTQWI